MRGGNQVNAGTAVNAAGEEATDREAAERALREHPGWYHSIELAPGLVTPGDVDLRACASRVLPDRLEDRRALDVGTFDGFWAFEMERRGADVVAIDNERFELNDWAPLARQRLRDATDEAGIAPGAGFRRAAAVLGSSARWVACGAYELEPGRIGGPVDFAFAGAILMHLRDPVEALERILASLAPGGELRIMEAFSPWLSLVSRRRPAARFQILETEFNWWLPNLACLRGWLAAAGFSAIERRAVVRPKSVARMRQSYAVLSAKRP